MLAAFPLLQSDAVPSITLKVLRAVLPNVRLSTFNFQLLKSAPSGLEYARNRPARARTNPLKVESRKLKAPKRVMLVREGRNRASDSVKSFDPSKTGRAEEEEGNSG
jgi:hypothetical protein